MTRKYLEAYNDANAACDSFQTACVKQFGPNKAADGRYAFLEHNEETAAARERFIVASKNLQTALTEMRRVRLP